MWKLMTFFSKVSYFTRLNKLRIMWVERSRVELEKSGTFSLAHVSQQWSLCIGPYVHMYVCMYVRMYVWKTPLKTRSYVWRLHVCTGLCHSIFWSRNICFARLLMCRPYVISAGTIGHSGGYSENTLTYHLSAGSTTLRYAYWGIQFHTCLGFRLMIIFCGVCPAMAVD